MLGKRLPLVSWWGSDITLTLGDLDGIDSGSAGNATSESKPLL